MARGYFLVTNQLLVELLRLPAGTRIIAARTSGPSTAFYVEHDDIPAATCGREFAAVKPTYQKNYDKLEPSIEFIEWGNGE